MKNAPSDTLEKKLAALPEKQQEIAVKEEAATEEKEERKSWARSLLYPLNHALSCLFTDFFIQPFTGAWVERKVQQNEFPKWLGNIVGAPPSASDKPSAPAGSSFLITMKYWLSGEVIGDLSAVPLTALVHRFVPSFTNGVRKLAEPVTRKFFEKGARRSAEKWAIAHNLDPKGPEALARQKELYEYETNHLGDVLAWNAFSTLVGVEAQKKLGSPANRKTLYTGKIFGAIVSNTMLLSGRATMPDKFQKAEDKISHVSAKILGVRHDKIHDKTERSWVDETERKPSISNDIKK